MLIYKPGRRVSQDQYGSGTVIECNEQHTVIDFDDHGVRKFVTRMVNLTNSTTAAPSGAQHDKARTK